MQAGFLRQGADFGRGNIRSVDRKDVDPAAQPGRERVVEVPFMDVTAERTDVAAAHRTAAGSTSEA